jgi:hypothetical protein
MPEFRDAPAESRASQDDLVEMIIGSFGGDSRAAVAALLRINSTLLEELHALMCKQAYEERLTASRRH